MFSDKLSHYDKPCGWLKFLLNVLIPLLVFGFIWDIVSMAAGWTTFSGARLVQAVVLVVVLILSDLMARFLDKAGFIALLTAHGLAILNDIISAIYGLVILRQLNSVANGVTSDIPAAGTFFDGIMNMATGLAAAFEMIGLLVLIVIYSCSLAYVIKRKDLFLEDGHPEDLEYDD